MSAGHTPEPAARKADWELRLEGAAAFAEEYGGHEGCACRWDEKDNRVATCARHQGWLDVVSEWADRAKAAEARTAFDEDALATKVHALLWEPQPSCCGQTCEGGSYMGMSEEICCGNPEYDSLSDAEIVRRLKLLVPHGSVATDPIPF